MRKLLPISLSTLGILFFVASSLYGQQWSGILSPNRAIDWSNAGVLGGIPSAGWTQCGSTISAGASAATINSAIAGCGANHYVQLGAGTFNLSTGIVFKAINNVAIRGMGANQTFLVFSGVDSCQGVYAAICVDSSDTNWQGGPSNLVDWTAGYSKGTTTITLASVPNLKIGNPIILDQLDDTTDTGGILVCSSPTNPGGLVCSVDGNNGNGQRTSRGQVQIVTVAGCNGSTTIGVSCSGTNVAVTISPGLYMPNWNACHASGGCAPQAWWATNPVTGDGVENLSIDSTNNGGTGSGVGFFNATNSWVSGIRSIDTARAHVSVVYGQHITVQNSYFWRTQNSIDQSYGYQCFTNSDVLIQNNIYQGISGPLLLNGACEGNVIAYNYTINDFYDGSVGWNNASSNLHAAGADLVLYEGNVLMGIYGDVFHGTHNFNTVFRNRLIGTQPKCWSSGTYSSATYVPCNNPLAPLVIGAYNRLFNIVGNVLGGGGGALGGGTPAQNTYVNNLGNYIGGAPYIYYLGGGNTAMGHTVPNDALTQSTMMRWGNYDTLTGAVRWCGNSSNTGWSTTCASTSEVPTGLSTYPNAVPASTALPASFFLSSKPAWWPSGKAWPPIGPDVTGGNLPGVAGHAYSNPATDCYTNIMNGPSDGTGSVLSFNAAACYGQQSVTSLPPTAPSNLTAVAH